MEYVMDPMHYYFDLYPSYVSRRSRSSYMNFGMAVFWSLLQDRRVSLEDLGRNILAGEVPYIAPDSPLRRAVKFGELARVKELMAKDGSELNKPNNKGWTLLHEAAASDNFLEVFKFLILAGAELDHKIENGVSPLYVACKYGSVKIAKILLEAGCKINDKFAYDHDYDKNIRFNFTCLHVACTRKIPDIIQLLISYGADLNVKDDIGRTPIHYAIDSANIDAVRMLVAAGADLLTKDVYGCSPLHYACMLGNIEIFNMLKFLFSDPSNLNDQTPEGLTPLMLACQFKHYLVSEQLIRLGADTTVVEITGVLALHMAANATYRLFKLVLEHTPKDVIKKYASFRGYMEKGRSLPCIVLESQYFESLQLLFNSGLSEEVLICPDKVNGHLVSPVGYLLLHNSRWFDKEARLKSLEFLLNYDFVVNPVYEVKNIIREELKGQMWSEAIEKIMEKPAKSIGSVEAVVQMHSHLHRRCYCELYLSMILSKISSPQKYLPEGAVRQSFLFHESAREGFLGALHLLKYSEYVDPDDVMEMFLKQMSIPQYKWAGHELKVIKFLIERCLTNFTSTFLKIKNSLPAPQTRDDEIRQRGFQKTEELFKSDVAVLSLKRICRFSVRQQIRTEAVDSSETFRSYLKKIVLPSSLAEYLLYDDI